MTKNQLTRKAITAVLPNYFTDAPALGYHRYEIVGEILIQSAITSDNAEVTHLKAFDGKSIHDACQFPTAQISRNAVRKLAGYLTKEDVFGAAQQHQEGIDLLVEIATKRMPQKMQQALSIFRLMGLSPHEAFDAVCSSRRPIAMTDVGGWSNE